MDKRVIAFIAATVFAASAGASGMSKESSGSAMSKGGDQFSSLDANGDGKISKDEAQGDLKTNWSKADTNNDGSVDQSEFSAFEAENPSAGSSGSSSGSEK